MLFLLQEVTLVIIVELADLARGLAAEQGDEEGETDEDGQLEEDLAAVTKENAPAAGPGIPRC